MIPRQIIYHPWLYRFGFADNLTLDPEVLIPPVLPVPGSTAELTSAGTDFLLQVWTERYS